jgi:hypothetical protein
MICNQIPNLLYGGRIISASHVAFASTRVMATCGNNGNALGMATALCKKLQVDPIQLLEKKNMKMLQTELMRFGQFIPGYKLDDPLDLVRQATSVTASSTFELSELPADGPPKVLTRSLAQMIPLPAGGVPNFSVTVQAVEDTTLVVQLRGSKKAYNYTPEVILAEREYMVTARQSTNITIDLTGVSNPHTQYVFLCFMENESIAICTTRTRVSGLMTVEHECTQSPPSGVGVDTFERWTPVRRPMGQNLALRVDPPVRAWEVDNIRNGVARPTKRANCWVPANISARRMLTLRWDSPVQVSRLVVHFDTDYDHALESVLRGHPERHIPFCVKSWRALDLSKEGEEGELFREDDNHLSRAEASFETVQAASIGVEILEVHGDEKHTLGGIFEIRAYE